MTPHRRKSSARITTDGVSLPALAELLALVHNVADSHQLKPGALIRLVNSTPLGPVLDARRLRAHRDRSGLRIGDGQTINLFRYAAWLADERRKPPAAAAAASTSAPTLKELAAAMEVSVRTLNTWIARRCPRGPLAAVKAWHAENVQPRKGGPRTERDPVVDAEQQALQKRMNESNARKAEQDARFKQIKTDKLAGEMWHRDDVIREAAAYFSHARTVLDTLPDAIAKEFAGEERLRARAVAKQKVVAVLRILADWRDARSSDA